MPAFRLTQRAKADLKEIGRYTQRTWGREQRNRYLATLDASFHDLAQTPQKGRRCDDIRQGYRKYQVGRHVIFYRQEKTDIEIIRILHDRMDVETQLAGDEEEA
jgi:toxin ParE1/3/4